MFWLTTNLPSEVSASRYHSDLMLSGPIVNPCTKAEGAYGCRCATVEDNNERMAEVDGVVFLTTPELHTQKED